MSWESRIEGKRKMAMEYLKDAEVLAVLASHWPEGLREPDMVSVAANSRTAVTATFHEAVREETRQLVSQLQETFHIPLPGFMRTVSSYSGRVSAWADVSFAGVTLRLDVEDLGPAPNCQLVAHKEMVEQTTWEMVCDEPEEAPVEEPEEVTP